MTLFFRTVGCLCPDFDYAMKFAACIITLFVLTSVSTTRPLKENISAAYLTNGSRAISFNIETSRSGYDGSTTSTHLV